MLHCTRLRHHDRAMGFATHSSPDLHQFGRVDGCITNPRFCDNAGMENKSGKSSRQLVQESEARPADATLRAVAELVGLAESERLADVVKALGPSAQRLSDCELSLLER